MKQKHLAAADRRAEILEIALMLSRVKGYHNVTREELATMSNCSPSLISARFGTMSHLRRAIMSAAIASEDVRVLAQGLAHREAKALAAPLELRQAAAATLVKDVAPC